MVAKRKKQSANRQYNVRRDTLDFRDKMYQATLVEVPSLISLDTYKKAKVPILDQGAEGACTGFGLATVANYLLRTRKIKADSIEVSPRMFYEMARRYDEWPGENYDGSSPRGAMKGWHKHGICSAKLWPYDPKKTDSRLTDKRVKDAVMRPLGAYYRVNHQDLVAMHSALAETGILYASATVHAGWEQVQADGVIPLKQEILGGHAFAIVAYDERGFWIQNSWGDDWGKQGFALITYDDWLSNGSDIWVARLGAPVMLHAETDASATHSTGAVQSKSYAYPDLRPHIISIGNDGTLRNSGTYGTSAADVEEIFKRDFPRITQSWKKKRLLIYVHGGLTDEKSALQRVADYRNVLLEHEIYPLAFVWKTDYWTTLTNMLDDAQRRRRPEGFLDDTKDFMLDRLDDILEPLARTLTGKAQWDEMKENALLATTSAAGGARYMLGCLAALLEKDPAIEVHVVGHSAGSIFHAPLIQLLTAKGKINAGPMKGEVGFAKKVESCTLWAPACTVDLFKQTYMPAIQNGGLGRFALFTLTDDAEQDDDCANIYHKSLLYMVSNAFEARQRIPLFQNDGEPILGMEKFVASDPDLVNLFKAGHMGWVKSPNDAPANSPDCSKARRHGDFDDDEPTLQATLARILQVGTFKNGFTFPRSSSSLRRRRMGLGAGLKR